MTLCKRHCAECGSAHHLDEVCPRQAEHDVRTAIRTLGIKRVQVILNEISASTRMATNEGSVVIR